MNRVYSWFRIITFELSSKSAGSHADIFGTASRTCVFIRLRNSYAAIPLS